MVDITEEPSPPRSLHESLERFGGAWIAAGVTASVAATALAGRYILL